MRRFTPFALILAGALALGVGCNKSDKQGSAGAKSGKMASGNTLYDRLGGEKAIQAVVHSFVQRGASDPKVNFTRKGHPTEWNATPENVARLEKRLVEFIGQNTGGPQKYQGRDMVTSHRGMKITEAEFNALAGHLVAALDEFKVPQKEKDELLAIVGSTKSQIVGK